MTDLAWTLWNLHASDTAKVALDAALERLGQEDPSPDLQWASRAHRFEEAPLGAWVAFPAAAWDHMLTRRGALSPGVVLLGQQHIPPESGWIPSFGPIGKRHWPSPLAPLPICSFREAEHLLGLWSLLTGQRMQLPSTTLLVGTRGFKVLVEGGNLPPASYLEWTSLLGDLVPGRFWTDTSVGHASSGDRLFLFPRTAVSRSALYPTYDAMDPTPNLPHLCPGASVAPLTALVPNVALRTDVAYAEQVPWVFARRGRLDRANGLSLVLPTRLLAPCPACWIAAATAYAQGRQPESGST